MLAEIFMIHVYGHIVSSIVMVVLEIHAIAAMCYQVNNRSYDLTAE